MTRGFLWTAIVGLAVCANGSLEARTPVSIFAAPSEIISARPRVSGQQWAFEYRAADGAPVRYAIAQDFAFVIKPNEELLYDFALKRVFYLDSAGRKYTHGSLYLGPIFRDYELQNRVNMRARMSKAGIELPEMMQPFWIETDLAHSSSSADLKGAKIVDEGKGAFRVEYAGETVARFTPEPTDLPRAVVKAFYRVVRHNFQIHPGAVMAMEKTGRVARRLQATRLTVKGRETASLTLQDAPRAAPAVYPLMGDFKPVPEEMASGRFGNLDKSFVEQYIPIFRAAHAPHETGRPKDLAEYNALLRAALQSKRIQDATFLWMEASTAFTPVCGPSKDKVACDFDALKQNLAAALKEDKVALIPIQAGMIEEKDRPRAILMLERQASRESPYSYRLDNFLGNAYGKLATGAMNGGSVETIRALQGRTDRHFLAAFKGNARLRFVYDDYAGYFFRSFRPAEAFLLWDAGRSATGIGNMPSQVEEYESEIEKRHPQYF